MAILISDIAYTTANSGSSNVASLTTILPSSNAGDGLILIAYSNYSGSGIRIRANSNFFIGVGFTSGINPGNSSNGYFGIWEAVSNGNMTTATVEPDGSGSAEFSTIAIRVRGSQRIRLVSSGSSNTAASGVGLSTLNGTVSPTHDGGLQLTVLGVNQSSSYVSGDEPTGYTFINSSNTTNTWVAAAVVEKPTANVLGLLSWNKSTSGNRRMQTVYIEPDVPWAGIKTTSSGSETYVTVNTVQRLQSWSGYTYLAKTNQEVYDFGIRIGTLVGDGKGVEIGLYNVTNGHANATLIANATIGTLLASQYNTVGISPVSLVANNKYAVAYRANSITNIAAISSYQDNGAGQGVMRQSSQTGTSPLPASWDYDNGTGSNRHTIWASIRDIILRLDDVNTTENVITGQKNVIATGSLLSGQTIQIISGTRTINTSTVSSTNTTLTFDVPTDDQIFLANIGFGSVTFNIASNTAVGLAGTLNPNSSYFIHTAANTSQNANSGCLYFNLSPSIDVGDKFYLPVNTSLNNSLTIDSLGFPVINSSSDITEFFQYRIYDPADSTWGTEGTFVSLGATNPAANSRLFRVAKSDDGKRYSKFPAGGTYTPTISQNFNSFSEGTSLSGNNPFDAAGRTKANTTTKYGATGASALMSIRTGDLGGFGNWGGILNLPRSYAKNEEIWVRWRQYWPSSFQFTATPYMKFLRFRTDSAGANQGYIDLYIDDASGAGVTYRTIKENQDIWQTISNGAIPRDQWITYEVYVYLDNVSTDNGGKGRMRFWINGNLAQDRTDITTLTGASHTVPALYWFTYWNNENPPNNDTYVDDIIIATSDSPPYSLDSGNRVFIGT